jgi:hypothetical protein
VIRSFSLFLTWVIVGFVLSWALPYGFTPIGPLLLLFGWLAYRYVPRVGSARLPELFGALGGVGVFLLVIASSIDGDAKVLYALGALAIAASGASYVLVRHRLTARPPGAEPS